MRKPLLAALLAGGLLAAPVARGDDTKPAVKNIAQDRVSLFQVPFT